MADPEHRAKETRLTYAVAELFPPQGQWTEGEYLALHTNRLIELSDGNLEVLAMPSELHQRILGKLYVAVHSFVTGRRLGEVRFSPLPVRLWPGKFREPDLVFMSEAHRERIAKKYWGIPDLAVEVVSPDDPDRDRAIKHAEYAQAGIPEYWIVDPEAKTVEVYRLPDDGDEYRLEQSLGESDTLTSTQLPGLELRLAELFAA